MQASFLSLKNNRCKNKPQGFMPSQTKPCYEDPDYNKNHKSKIINHLTSPIHFFNTGNKRVHPTATKALNNASLPKMLL